jgi:pSer/pThr/pTyr-binding forkhead associated (FHA) protein
MNKKTALNPDDAVSKRLKRKATEPVVQISGEGLLNGVSVTRQFINDKNNIIRIGRDEGWSDIVVKDMIASRKHAELCFDSSGKMIVSDMSLNGTKVNGIRLNHCNREYSGKQDVRIMITEQCGVLVKFGKNNKNDILEKEIV